MKKPAGLMPLARIKASPVSRLCMYSGVDASVLLACASEFIHTGLPKECKHASNSLRWKKNEVLRNYHKMVEAGTVPSPGFKCADF